jgi:hypothetical protein
VCLLLFQSLDSLLKVTWVDSFWGVLFAHCQKSLWVQAASCFVVCGLGLVASCPELSAWADRVAFLLSSPNNLSSANASSSSCVKGCISVVLGVKGGI